MLLNTLFTSEVISMKKRWITNQIEAETKDFLPSISWSSSESDDDRLTSKRSTPKVRKLPKVECTQFFIDEHSTPEDVSTNKVCNFERESLLDSICFNHHNQNTEVSDQVEEGSNQVEEGSNQVISSVTQEISKVIAQNLITSPKISDLEMSPVITRNIIKSPECFNQNTGTKPPEVSPVITQSSIRSPVISSNRKLKTIKRKVFKNSKDSACSTLNFNLVFSRIKAESPEATIEVDSSQSSHLNDEMEISQVSSQSNENNSEEALISQFSNSQRSNVTTAIVEVSSSSSSFKSSDSILRSCESTSSSYEPVLIRYRTPKRRRYKKDGFAKKLRKAISDQQGSISIWEHELYLNKERGYALEEEDGIELTVLRETKELGVTVVECLINNETFNDQKCFVIPSRNVRLNCQNKIITIYKPYGYKIIKYYGKDFPCYYDVYKVL